MTLKYRWSLIGSFVCCLFVAVLWGANLGAVYPFVEIVLKGDTLHEWIDNQDDETLSAIATIEGEIKTLTAQGIDDDNKSALARLNSNLGTEQDKQWWNEALRPYVKDWAPKTAFQTLAWLMGLMFIGTVLRGIFLMGNMVLVARVGQRTVLDLQNEVFRNVLQMETSEMEVKGTGDLISRIRGETSVVDLPHCGVPDDLAGQSHQTSQQKGNGRVCEVAG